LDQALRGLKTRLVVNVLVTVFLAAIVVWGVDLYDISLRDTRFLTGWLLFSGVSLLAVYNLRKKVPFIPLFRASIWLQCHIYIGWLTGLIFLFHTNFDLPNGGLEILLWILFFGVFVSGVLGIILLRWLPPRIRDQGERHVFERIRLYRAQIAEEAAELAMQSVRETASNTISQFYVEQMQPYLDRPRNVGHHLAGSSAPIAEMRRKIRALGRYSGAEGKTILQSFNQLAEIKDNLDFQYSLQIVMKAWLFVHIPLTYALGLVIVVHIILVYAFSSGAI